MNAITKVPLVCSSKLDQESAFFDEFLDEIHVWLAKCEREDVSAVCSSRGLCHLYSIQNKLGVLLKEREVALHTRD